MLAQLAEAFVYWLPSISDFRWAKVGDRNTLPAEHEHDIAGTLALHVVKQKQRLWASHNTPLVWTELLLYVGLGCVFVKVGWGLC